MVAGQGQQVEQIADGAREPIESPDQYAGSLPLSDQLNDSLSSWALEARSARPGVTDLFPDLPALGHRERSTGCELAVKRNSGLGLVFG
jgi:hypothetical protein